MTTDSIAKLEKGGKFGSCPLLKKDVDSSTLKSIVQKIREAEWGQR